MSTRTLRICAKGHHFYKSSDCNTCPTCAQENKPQNGFLASLSAPARSALVHHGIDTLEKLAAHSKKEILRLHGMGKASMPTLEKALQEAGLSFKE